MPKDPNLLSFPKASEYLNIDQKALENYIKKGNEIPRRLVGKVKKLHKEDLDAWKEYFDATTVILDQESYYKALRFSIRKFYSDAPKANFATETQRGAGQYLTNHIQGYLSELAFQKFMADKFDIKLILEDNIDGIVRSQDIVAVSKRRGVERPPAARISVKSSKIKNVILAVKNTEVEMPDRESDYYVYTRVDLSVDHIVRLIQKHPSVEEIKNIIPPEESSVKTQVCGFVEREKLDGPIRELPGIFSFSSLNYFKKSGELNRDWNRIAEAV